MLMSTLRLLFETLLFYLPSGFACGGGVASDLLSSSYSFL